ncbi:MAG: hypothetical protein Q8Q42_04110, partial [Nanoarchaeota archaeon]|nr:hypothetical protein [Nanoarchaeota archaeon]
MTKNGLIGKLKRGIYSTLTAGALGLGSLIGCDKNPVDPSNPPQNTLSVSPTSGMSPLQIRVQGHCTDPNGDLRNYQITSGGSIITRTNPIDTLI